MDFQKFMIPCVTIMCFSLFLLELNKTKRHLLTNTPILTQYNKQQQLNHIENWLLHYYKSIVEILLIIILYYFIVAMILLSTVRNKVLIVKQLKIIYKSNHKNNFVGVFLYGSKFCRICFISTVCCWSHQRDIGFAIFKFIPRTVLIVLVHFKKFIISEYSK